MLLFYFQQTIIVKPPPEALLKELPRYSTRRTLQAMEEGTLFYKLGQEAAYKQYINQFTNNPHALSKVQANEERVKRTHMSHKFSLTDVSTFRWMGMYYYLSIFGHIWRNVEFLALFFFLQSIHIKPFILFHKLAIVLIDVESSLLTGPIKKAQS